MRDCPEVLRMVDLYNSYFRQTLYELPYEDPKEAENDILALADCCIRAAFWGKDVLGDRMEMRGVVITPGEVEAALLERCIAEADSGSTEAVRKAACELSRAFGHVLYRHSQDVCTPIGRLIKVLELKKKEIFFFFLTLCCEFDRKYERLYGYLQDNVAVRLPTRGLLESLWKLIGMEDELIEEESFLWKYLIQGHDSSVRPGAWLSKEFSVYPGVFDYIRTGYFAGQAWEGALKQEDTGGRIMITLSLKHAERLLKDNQAAVRQLAGLLSLAHITSGADVYLSHSSSAEEAGMIPYLESCLELLSCPYQWEENSRSSFLKPGAVHVPIIYEWKDLILEEESKRLLTQICGHIRYRPQVQKEWGFGEKSPYGNGVSALFYGPPGTGKTMAAQVIARELEMKLFKVDISQLVSKYIGETEKNISRLFEKAASMRAVLFFDEADGLFAKRTEIGNSNDRYANMETGYLLQKFEEYEGVSILATNLVNQVDDAFKRRIKFLVKFTQPGQGTRLLLWKSMVPAAARVDEPLFLEDYARYFEIPGSGIREVITNAAYLAAEDGRGIYNRHLKQALKVYYLKYGKTLTDAELERCGN